MPNYSMSVKPDKTLQYLKLGLFPIILLHPIVTRYKLPSTRWLELVEGHKTGARALL